MLSTQAKIDTLWDKYRENAIVQELQDDVEQIKRRATFVGAATTGGLLIANETARFAMRSPLFKLNPITAVVVLGAPTLIAKQLYNDDIDQKVSNLWRIHKNRQSKGLDGTYSPSNDYPEKNVGSAIVDPYGVQVGIDELIDGVNYDVHFDHPFSNWSHELDEQPQFFEDNDRLTMPIILDNLERNKPFVPAEGSVVGDWYMDPPQDKDDKYRESGIDGDHLWADPPDANFGPAYDHRLDEEKIWNFAKSHYNQEIVENEWTRNPEVASERTHMPFWSDKLLALDYSTKDK